jgi:hypothetical protein
MPIQKIALKPGVYREGTSYSAEGQFYDGDKIRFRSGNAEKIGGWVRLANTTFLGTSRSLWNWSTLDGKNLLGIGTNLKYYIEFGGTYNDVTPIRKVVDPMLGPVPPSSGNPFATAYSTLTSGITSTQSSLTLTSAASFSPNGGVILIDSEQIFYSQVSGNILLGLSRGFNGTTAAAHLSGAGVGSSTVIVTDVNHDATDNDFITYSGVTGPIGGIAASSFNQELQVFRYISTARYSINATNPTTGAPVFSTSAASGGGTVAIAEYQVNTGLDVYIVGLGWGADPWSAGGWGSPATIGVGQQLRLWTADNYGEDLIIAPRNGGIYYWDATLGLTERAEKLSTLSTAAGYSGQFVPTETAEVVTSPTESFVIAMGANPYDPTDANTPFDPLLVRWSDQENPFEWVPAITNQSGELRLSLGNYIVGSSTTRQEILIWTDGALYSMQYLGPPYVWGFNVLADNISIMSPNAMTTANNVTYWMGRDKFYVYSGRTETLPCALRQYIFNDLNLDQSYQVFSGSNEAYNEVWWFYCSNGSTVINKYVIYNYLENLWYYGTMERTSWIDSSNRSSPMATDYNNRVLYHEVGTDDVSGTSPVAINAHIQSADFDIGDGDRFAFVWRILPDINFNGSYIDRPTVTMTVKPRRNAGAAYGVADVPTVQSQDNYTSTRSYNIQQFDGQVYTRLRGRQMALRIESNEIGVAWQLGSIRIDVKSDGRR